MNGAFFFGKQNVTLSMILMKQYFKDKLLNYCATANLVLKHFGGNNELTASGP